MKASDATTFAADLTLVLVAGAFTIVGIGMKMLYDYLIERARSKREAERYSLPLRREAYESFLAAERRQREYVKRLDKLYQRHLTGETRMSEDEVRDFPPSPMPELVEALHRIERVAGDYAVISAARNIVRLFGDMAAARKRALASPGPNDEIVWFLLQRFEEDREREFVYAYRRDLGLGEPAGAPKNFPIPSRPWALSDAEAILRSHFLEPPRKDGDDTAEK